MEFETVIGLEVHAQLNTQTKIFCGCSTLFGQNANSQTCPVCLALPGALPVFNREVLQKSILAGLALNCEIQLYNKFDRKNYFYPDLPKAYQISQYDQPICLNGHLMVPDEQGHEIKLGITRIHMEEDAGKLIHSEDPDVEVSYVNLNRAGVPLIEIVGEPDIRSGQQAYDYLTALKSVLEYIDVSDCNMEEGSLRCDANVSIRPVGQKEFGTRVEIKNLNSFKAVRAAIEYEAERHRELILEGKSVRQATRLWDGDKNITRHMRYKEDEMDYRYFPEPDLPPIILKQEMVDQIAKTLPELPRQKRERYMADFGMNDYDASVLTADRHVAAYFETALENYRQKNGQGDVKKLVNWMTTEIMGSMNAAEEDISTFAQKVPAAHLAELVATITGGEISGKMGKKVFEEMIATSEAPAAIIDRLGLKQVSDAGELEGIIDKIVADNPDSVEKYRSGKDRVFGFFVGQVMKATKGQANPQVVNDLLKKKLS